MTRTMAAAPRSARSTTTWNAQADEPGGQHRDDDARARRDHFPLAVQLDEGEVGGEGADGALREVDQARPAVDEHRALGEQGVGGAGAEPDDQELQERLHGVSIAERRAGGRSTARPRRSLDQQVSGGAPKIEPQMTSSKLIVDDLDEVALEPVALGLGVPLVGGPVVHAGPLEQRPGGRCRASSPRRRTCRASGRPWPPQHRGLDRLAGELGRSRRRGSCRAGRRARSTTASGWP